MPLAAADADSSSETARSAQVAQTTSDQIAARMDRLPTSLWHTKVRAILGTATFFDAFDAVAIAFVMPTLIGLWQLRPTQVGLLIASGFAGQALGAISFSWLAERYGRIRMLNWTILILSLGGLACGLAWDYSALLVFRFIQGLGIGGELPVAAAYVSEISKTQTRGRFFLYYQLLAPVGFAMASVSSIFIVPNLGWRWMFLLGALPAFLTIGLRRFVPESPRWLAQKGELARADETLVQIEAAVRRDTKAPLPEPVLGTAMTVQRETNWRGLFEGIYRRRTIMLAFVWFAQAIIAYGLLTWIPTIFRTIYKLPVQDALMLSSIGNALVVIQAVCSAELVDRIGRRPIFLVSFGGAAISLILLFLVVADIPVLAIALLTAVTSTFLAMGQFTVWIYTPELYPTRMRALGGGFASSWARIGSIAAPVTIGYILTSLDLSMVFAVFAGISTLGFIVIYLLAQETRSVPLETLSP
jgi:putative MFS transporter